MELKNRVALVTGAGQGIGQAIALKMAKEGAIVMVNDMNVTAAQKTADTIIAQKGKAEAYPADVTDREKIVNMVSDIVKKYGSIDILVNNVGTWSKFLIEDMPFEQWDKTMAVTLTGSFNCCKAVIPYMIEKKYGKIIFIASVAGQRISASNGADYSAAKHGIIGLQKHLAYELGRHNINVNAVCPGIVLTEAIKSQFPDVVSLKAWAKDMPMCRAVEPNDVAEAVTFLASEKAKQITGHSLNVESGVMIMSSSHYEEDMDKRIKANKLASEKYIETKRK